MNGSLADLSRRLYDEVWNGRYEAAAELFHPDFTHAAAPGLRGPEAKLAAIRRYRTALPDLHVKIEDMVVQDDQVAVRASMSGTDTGGFAGRPPTGRVLQAWAVDFLGFRDHQIITDWTGADWLGTFVQLGVIDNPWT
jgi:predicted ester cyclase